MASETLTFEEKLRARLTGVPSEPPAGDARGATVPREEPEEIVEERAPAAASGPAGGTPALGARVIAPASAGSGGPPSGRRAAVTPGAAVSVLARTMSPAVPPGASKRPAPAVGAASLLGPAGAAVLSSAMSGGKAPVAAKDADPGRAAASKPLGVPSEVRVRVLTPLEAEAVSAVRAKIEEKRTFPAGPTAVAESERDVRMKAALKLYDRIPPQHIRYGAVGSSRVHVPPAELMRARVEALAGAGGKAGDASNKARLFLDEWLAFLAKHEVDQPGDPFPMATSDLVRFRNEAPSKTARERVTVAAEHLRSVVTEGLVTLDEVGLKVVRVRKPVCGSARAPMGPFYLISSRSSASAPPRTFRGARWSSGMRPCKCLS